MSEVWLRTNVRGVLWGMVLPALVGVFLWAVAEGFFVFDFVPWMLRYVAGFLAAMCALLLVLSAVELRQSRLTYRGGHLLVKLTAGPPERVPIEFVEGFLLGQGPSHLSRSDPERMESRTVIVRLDEMAEEFAHRMAKPALGEWCNGYITIRGTWCEPLSISVVNRLNRRLADAKRAREAVA